MKYAIISIVEQVGPSSLVAVDDDVTAEDLAVRLGGSVIEPSPATPAPAPSPAPNPAPRPVPEGDLWWQQRPFDAQWIVDTIAKRWAVTSEPTDVEHLEEKNGFDARKAYIDYLDVQYRHRAED